MKIDEDHKQYYSAALVKEQVYKILSLHYGLSVAQFSKQVDFTSEAMGCVLTGDNF